MSSFGDSLRQAREERGVTLDAIANDTRISRKYLHALERGDLETLPGGAFDHGYIRAYAESLGIDAEPILEAYKEKARQIGRGTAESEQQKLAELSRLLERRSGNSRPSPLLSRGKFVFAVAALVGVFAMGSWLATREDESAERPTRAPVASSPRLTASRTNPSEADAKAGLPRRPEISLEPEPESPPDTAGIAVSGSGVGTGVIDRQLVGRADHFSAGTEVWFWTRIVGGESGQVVRHVWMQEGRVAMASELSVGGSHWRTYSRLTLPPGGAGEWVVEARASDGRRLARQEFVCTE